MKIVLDNNVFISGIFWKGTPHKIIQLAEKHKIEVHSSIEILEELFGVLKRKKFNPYFQEAEITTSQVFEKILELVKICIPLIKFQVIKKDSDDNKFLECAFACGACFIVSGDQHLLQDPVKRSW